MSAPIDINELTQRLTVLSAGDKKVLESLKPELPSIAEELASKLYILPKEIYDSIDRLISLSLVEPLSQDSSKSSIPGELVVRLTQAGKTAQALTKLAEGSYSLNIAATPRYKKTVL